MHQWSKSLKDIVNRRGSLQDLVDVTEGILNNFLDVSDATYTLVAYTKHIEAVDSLSKELQALGCHSKLRVDNAAARDVFKEWRSQDGVEVFNPDEISPYPYATKVIRHNGEYQGHVVMVCNNVPPTRGTLDLFSIFALRCEVLALQLLEERADKTHPASGFIAQLLTDERRSQAYIENQLLILGMADDSEFRVCTVDISASIHHDNAAFLFSELQIQCSASNIISLMHENQIVLVYHGCTWSREIQAEDDHLLLAFCNKYGCTAFLSDRFHKIRSLRFAYQQTLYAQKYRYFIDVELRPLDDIDTRRLFRFEEAFCFYCYENRTDDEFGFFCISHTILDEMIEKDRQHDVSDLKILYYYLFNERKATPTSKQLHMHRNNVLYRIDSIEKRYGLDLNRYETRQRLLHCFRIKIMTSWQFRNLLVS